MNGKVQRKHQRSQATARRQQALLVRAVFGSLVLCATFGAPTTTQATPSFTQGVSQQDASLRVEWATEVFRRGFRDICKEIAAGQPDLERLDLTFNQRGQTNEIVNAGDIRWNDSVEKFVDALSLSGALGNSLLSVSLKNEQQKFSARVTATFEAELNVAPAAQNIERLRSLARSATNDKNVAVALNSMVLSANGKQLVMQLEMSREQAGNLLRQQLSLP